MPVAIFLILSLSKDAQMLVQHLGTLYKLYRAGHKAA
jgi:hypothetical protein